MYGWYVRPGIGFVGKMENLPQDLMTAFALMELHVDSNQVASAAKQNETPSRIPRPEWDPALKQETLRLEYAGYVRYGYPIEDGPPAPASKNVLSAEMSAG